MSKPKGKSVAVSRFRRLVLDLMHFSAKVPSVCVERRMPLGPLVLARKACAARPTWASIFTKAYAIVAARTPVLRRCYLPYPWPHYYESFKNVATVNIERRLGDERIVLYCHIRRPENRSLEELDAIVRSHKELPLEQIKSYRRADKLSRVPGFVRRLVWWVALNFMGGLRTHNFGTFSLTTIAAHGAGVLHVVPLLTSTIHYGLFDENGDIDMRITFDHRVLDGVTAADALADLEEVLLGEILEEVRGLPKMLSLRAA